MCRFNWKVRKTWAENWSNNRFRICLFRKKLRKLLIHKSLGYTCMLLYCSHPVRNLHMLRPVKARKDLPTAVNTLGHLL